jgi:hypothetical protein
MTMNKRAQIDQIAWDTIHARAPFAGTPAGLARSRRPANYKELGEHSATPASMAR